MAIEAVEITAGSGTKVAVDTVDTDKQVQYVKLMDPTDGSATPMGTGGGTEATAIRVTIASDSTGVVSVDDNGSTITVDGTVTARGAAFSVVATLTVTNGAYSVADVVGGLITWAGVASANGGSVTIDTVTLNGVVAIPYELWFYSADIATPRLDNAVFGLAAADGLIALGYVQISAADYATAQTTFVEGTVRGAGITLSVGAGTTSLYGYLKATATTSPGTTTLYLRISGVRND